MVQPNRRGRIIQRATTHLELHRITSTRNNYELKLILWAEPVLVITMLIQTGVFTPNGTSPLAHQGVEKDATPLRCAPSSIAHLGGQDWRATHDLWDSTQTPDPAVPHSFFQPIDCLMPNPRPSDACWV